MKNLLRICFILSFHTLFSQPYGNEWIDYSQTYYKFPVVENGIHRISYQSLVNSGVPLSTINPQNIQLFARGKEIPIYLAGEADGTFNPSDFIEFYAEKNDGWLDSVFYKGRNNQPNPYYSLINDTIHYYLTWNSGGQARRIQEETAIDFGNYFPAAYVWKEQMQSYSNTYYDGEILPSQATDPEYVPSEGYMFSPLALGQSRNMVLSTPNRYSSGPFVEFEAKIAGESNWRGQNNGDHHLQISIGNQTIDRIFEGYELIEVNASFSPSEIIAGNNNVTYTSIDDRNSDVDRTAVAYMKITYPHTMSFSNNSSYEFLLDDHNSQNKQYLEMLFFNGGNDPVLYDLTNEKRMRVIQSLNEYKALVPNSGGRKRCVISAESDIVQIPSLDPVGQNGQFTDYKTQLTDSVFLIITHPRLYVEATTYASYRRSQGKEVFIATVDELYHQYGYGIVKNPLSIRNFVEEGVDQWPFPPTHLFLLGKSVSAKYHRRNASAYAENLVPTFGFPAADNLLTAGLNQTFLEPIIPQGRLSAKNVSEVDAYLDKVIEFEAATPGLWMKQALHFAGGNSGFEARQLEGYLNGFGQDFRQPPMGGDFKTFTKSTSSPFQTSLSDSIRTLINNGVGLMTFFGHASATGNFDISIDSPDRLQNRGKYPFVLANSCFAGNYHQAGILSTAESYVLERNRGAIGFIANGNLGLASSLNVYSGTLYEEFANRNYNLSMAENMRLVVADIQSPNMDPSLKSICLEMSLQGDPILKLYPKELPDYLVSENQVFIEPEEVTTDLDSFVIRINIQNIGNAVYDSLYVELRQDYPVEGVNDTLYSKTLSPILYEDEVTFTLPIDLVKSVGENHFTFLVDNVNSITELSEFNNRIDFNILIRSGEILPIYPYQYAIIGEQAPTLKASTAFAFEDERQYRFELDTSADFSSLLKPTVTISSSGGVVEWQPTVLENMPDSAVYFWRVSPVPAPGEDYNWRTSSFQYIPNQTGWSQDHFDQFADNHYLFINDNRVQKQFEYSQNVRELYVFNDGNPSNSRERNDVRYAIDAEIRERAACVTSRGFLIAVLDSLTLDSWQTPYDNQHLQNDFGQANAFTFCSPNRNRSERYFLFRLDVPEEMDSMKSFLSSKIPNGNYIVLYSWQQLEYSQIWNRDSSILKAIENLGSNEISTLPDNHPFIFTVQKGNPASVMEVVGDSTNSEIDLERTLVTNADFGEMESVEVGPTTQWERLSYQFSSSETNSADSLSFELIGVNSVGSESVLFQSNKFYLDTAINQINSVTYPNLKLKVRSYDDALRTPPQLKRWQISHQALGDLALDPAGFFELENDSVQEGQALKFEISVQNPTDHDVDSFDVNVQVLDQQNRIHLIEVPKQAPLTADSTAILKIEVPTTNLQGEHSLIIELNPQRATREQYYFNNRGQFDFKVGSDNLNPLLDVTFDGRRILNREIVSAEPEIMVRLDDENNYLALDDTSTLALYLRRPNGQEELINYRGENQDQIQFVPATLPENQAKVIYRPQLSEDGIYRLRVSASDKSGNASGNRDYQVEFEIIKKSTVTHLLNYPNPFSNSTRFVFTLTGSQIPDRFQIQIMTVTGKVVREIDQFEIGPIHIGHNISEFAWDGKDEFGDQLANGVYLYRVKMKINDQNIEHRESNADQFFKEEFGKMYLLR